MKNTASQKNLRITLANVEQYAVNGLFIVATEYVYAPGYTLFIAYTSPSKR